MGVMTLEEFRDEVAGATQRSIQQLNTKNIDRWVNQAMQEFGYVFKFRELEGVQLLPTVIGTNSYPFPADFRMGHELGIQKYNSLGENLGKITPETRDIYLQRINASTVDAQGEPIHYHRFNTDLFLRPIPDAVYNMSIHYWKKLTPLAAKGDVSPFSDEWDEIIQLGAIYRAFRKLGEFDRWQILRNEFLALVRSRALEEDVEEFPMGSWDPYPRNQGELRTGLPGE